MAKAKEQEIIAEASIEAAQEIPSIEQVQPQSQSIWARSADTLKRAPKWALITVPAAVIALAGYGYMNQGNSPDTLAAAQASVIVPGPYGEPLLQTPTANGPVYSPAPLAYGPYYGPYGNGANGYGNGYGYGDGRGYGHGHGRGNGRMNASFSFGGDMGGSGNGGGNGIGNGRGNGYNNNWW